jgi:hypothetical protein
VADTDTVRKTVIFLRLAAAATRRIAGTVTHESQQIELRHVAEQCEAEAKDLASAFGLNDLLST